MTVSCNMVVILNICYTLCNGYTLKCLSIGTHKTIKFPFVPNGNLMVLCVPIFKHIVEFIVISKQQEM